MGSRASKRLAKDTMQGQEEDMSVFELKKDSPGCTGMFWRPDPRPETKGARAPSDNWPRDGALLKGVVHTVGDARWLECAYVKQKGSDKWADVPAGAWMPFRYQQYFLEESE